MMESVLCLYVTGHVKIGHVDTNYTLSLWWSYLSTETQYFHSVTCITLPNKFLSSAENFIVVECWNKKLWVQKDWKSRQKLCAHIPLFACLVTYVFIYLFIHRQCSKFVKGGNVAACSQSVAPAVLHSPHKATRMDWALHALFGWF